MSRTEVKSEISGSVFSVEVAVAQAVTTDEPLIVLESMKMEVPVLAPRDGTVAAVLVATGDSVEEGQVVAVLD